MEGTRHPHPAMQPMSPWQQQEYQQSGQQFQQPRPGQQFQQPRLGQQYQQPRFQPQFQESEFRQQHQPGLSQHFQESELAPLVQELGLGQFHQHPGFGQQHQPPRLTHSRPNEPFSQIFQQLPKQQQSQHGFDDKQHDYQSHQVGVSGQRQPLSPSPQQHKDAEIMSLLKELNKNAHMQAVITPPANLNAGLSAFSPNSRKETEPNKELQSCAQQTEAAMNVGGLQCAPSASQASIEGVNSTDEGSLAAVKVPTEKSMPHLPPSNESPSKLMCSKTPHDESSHDLPRFDFANITRPNRGAANTSGGQHGAAVSSDCSPSVESTLKNSNPSMDRSDSAFCSRANPSDERVNSVVCDDSSSCGNHLNRVDGDDTTSSDGRLSCALPDDSNPLDSVVQDDSNLSLNQLESVGHGGCSPSDDQLDTALRDDSNPSVDQLEKAIRDDSIPSVDPLDSTVCDDSNPSVDQLESTLCADPSYPVGPSKEQSGSSLGDFNPSDSQTGSALCGDTSPSDPQQVPELCDYSNPSSDKPESTVPENLRFSIHVSKNQSDSEFSKSNTPVSQLKTGVDNESHSVTRPSKDQSGPMVRGDTVLSRQPGAAAKVDSSPLADQPRTTVQDDSSKLSDKRSKSHADSNPSDAQPGTKLPENFKASDKSSLNPSDSQKRTTPPNCSAPPETKIPVDSNSCDDPPRTSQGDSRLSNTLPVSKVPDSSNKLDSSSRITLQLRNELRNDPTLAHRRSRNLLQDSRSSDGPPVTVVRDSDSSDIQEGTASQKDFTVFRGRDLNKSKPPISQTGMLVDSSQSESQLKTAQKSDQSGTKMGTTFLSNSHPSNDKSGTVQRDEPVSSDAQQKPAGCDSKKSDFQSGESNKSGDQVGSVSNVDSSLVFKPPKDRPESANHPSNPANSGSDLSPVMSGSGGESQGNRPEASVEEGGGVQVLEKSSELGDTNPAPISPAEKERNKVVVPSEESPAITLKDDFHFVEIKGTPVSVPTRVFADPLPADPFESQDIKPSAQLLAEALRHKEHDTQREDAERADDVQEIHSDGDVQTFHLSNTAAAENIPVHKDVDVHEIPTDQERDVPVVIHEENLSDDNDSTHFFEENATFVPEEKISAVCHVCETTVDSTRYKFHLFFGHLQCGHCNRRLVGCDMLQDMRDPKKSMCKKSDTKEHSFKDWTIDPIEFLSYYIRKELVIKRFCANLSGPPTVSEIVDEIDSYMNKLSSLATFSPWKSAITKCHNYVRERKAGAKGKDAGTKKTIVSVGYPSTKGKFTIKPFFMTGGHTSVKDNGVLRPVMPVGQSSATVSAQKTVEPIGRPSSQCQPAVAPVGPPKVTGLEKVRQPTEAVVLDEPSVAVASTSRSSTVPGEASGRNSSAKEPSQSGNKPQQSGALLLKYLSAGLNKKGRHSKAAAKSGDDSKKHSNLIKVPHMKNAFIKAPADGNYLVVHYPTQPCPELCPNCYCRFEPSKVTVNCSTSVITNRCLDCDLTLYVIQDPPHDVTQPVKLSNKRKPGDYRFTGPESKKSRRK